VATLWVYDYAAGEYNAALAIRFTEAERAQGRVLGVHYDEQQTLLIRRVLKQIPQHWRQAPRRQGDTESFRYMADRLLRHKLHGSLRHGHVANKLGYVFVVFGEREDMICSPSESHPRRGYGFKLGRIYPKMSDGKCGSGIASVACIATNGGFLPWTTLFPCRRAGATNLPTSKRFAEPVTVEKGLEMRKRWG